MNNDVKNTRYRWLLGILCVWLMSAWMAQQQPTPATKKRPKTATPSAVTTHRPVSKAKPYAKSSAVTRVAADTVVINGVPVDPESGLAFDETMPIVKGQCTACHSSKLILQSHFDREKWIERIRWMQRTQKLWDLGDTEKPILDYLAKYYGPIKTPFDGRRLPLDSPKWHSR